MKKIYVLVSIAFAFCSTTIQAQGTWRTLTNAAPNGNQGVMLLLTDGTVMTVTQDSALSNGGTYGNIWNLLTPDATGSYLNGTWSSLPPMHSTRLYFSSQVMPNGNVYVAGGEYGSGGNTAEIFNTTTHTWTSITKGITPGWSFEDANSKLLPDGTILQAVVSSNAYQSSTCLIYSPITNSYTLTDSLSGSSDEASWVTLPDGSIMNVDIEAVTSERYIPSTHKWIADANVPVDLYDNLLGETGAGFLLPNGKLFFLSDTTYTAIYTPSGNTSNGTWAKGPAMPKISGVTYGCPDAPAAMLPSGNILCAFSPAGTYNTPTYFYEYNYLTNAFTQVSAAGGGNQMPNTAAYYTTMLDLPDGTVLLAQQGDNNYYQYTPSATVAPLAAGKPTISSIIPECPNFKITGTLFNGICEGAAFGDDWQMATNYPIIRLTKGTSVYYAKSSNWNRVGAVMTGSLADTATFSVPSTIPAGTFSVQVIVNGNPSATYTLTLPCSNTTNIEQLANINEVNVYPNPATNIIQVSLANINENTTLIIADMLGNTVKQVSGINSQVSINVADLSEGVYTINVSTDKGAVNKRLVIVR